MDTDAKLVAVDGKSAVDEHKCDVCSSEPVKGVASSTFGAISLAYGERCLQMNAEAAFILESTFWTCGDTVEAYAEWVWDYTTYVDGKYISAREFFDQFVKSGRGAQLDAEYAEHFRDQPGDTETATPG